MIDAAAIGGYCHTIKLSRDYEQEQEQLKTVVEVIGRKVNQQEQKKTHVRKFMSMVKKHTDMTQFHTTIPCEFAEQIRVPKPIRPTNSRGG
ncbi:MAG: DUF4368 domain-containing protein [Oscillospiraceae bacterium]|jgi:site-specific DNA recombinase|nr:DUF4368 domain-containing protein [Oscillospiraceae bacterium]MCI9588762.1 DUF4368 domain-containing protein [Oscillospiraceae bacterium]